ncbi:helicase SNF2 [Streptomyces albus]|uniref:DEAD/DEAH box helicase n=1 Tax=Streptomyces physcomitrii TaxID=2724184 RepID=UPI000B2DBDE2|nr:helicase SNF2 [Streptomyces albus]
MRSLPISVSPTSDTAAEPTGPPAYTGLSHCRAVFVPGTARGGRVHFWAPDEEAPLPGAGAALDLVLPGPDGEPGIGGVRTLALPVPEALAVLSRAHADPEAHPAVRFWGAAALYALTLIARGRLLPGLGEDGADEWRCAPLEPDENRRLLELAAAAPPLAHNLPVPGTEGRRIAEPGALVRAFLDAVADALPRTAAAEVAAGGPALAGTGTEPRPELATWTEELAVLHGGALRLSLRIEVPGLTEAPLSVGRDSGSGAPFRAVLQVHGAEDPALVVDAALLWAPDSGAEAALGPRARTDTLLALRRAVRHWPPLDPLLSSAVPGAVELADEEVAELLGPGAELLAEAGVEVHWPKQLARGLSARAVVSGEEGAGSSGLLNPEALLSFRWQFALGEERLTAAQLDQLAEAARPLVRLGERWVLVDPARAAALRERPGGTLRGVEALGAALTGTARIGGQQVEVAASGRLARLRDLLTAPEDAHTLPQPAALQAQLRDYQTRGLAWLARLTGNGLGCCLADDMGLGKTLTLIALHLHRQQDPATAGPTLVVCPASLLGNWQREIERFAPGTPVRRHHGPARQLDGLAPGEVVLTTYGTMRLDAERLRGAPWALLVADEAQHLKNPYSATARALRTVEAPARVALTGTPVENNLTELWAILDWTTPGLLGRLGDFRARYADPVERGTDPAAADRLARLVRPFLLRRRKSDPGIAPELPAKTETDHAVPLTAEQAALYEAVVREMLDEIATADGMGRRGLIVRLLTALKQICNHPAQYLKEEGPALAGRSGKLALLDELLDTMLAEDTGVLVFTQYVRMARLLEARLAERGIRSQFLHGGTPVAEREAMVDRFQDGTVPVFLLSLRAAGTGLNLTRASHVVHYDRWWNPAVEAQATDRAYRIGQTRPVQVHRLIAEGTVEDRIDALLRGKQALAEAVLGGGEAALTELTDAELAALVSLQGGTDG